MDDREDVFPAAVHLDAGLPARGDPSFPPSIRGGPRMYGSIIIGSIFILGTKDRDLRHDF